MVKNEQALSEVRFAYETPNVSVTVLSSADVIHTSAQEPGGEYPENWK